MPYGGVQRAQNRVERTLTVTEELAVSPTRSSSPLTHGVRGLWATQSKSLNLRLLLPEFTTKMRLVML